MGAETFKSIPEQCNWEMPVKLRGWVFVTVHGENMPILGFMGDLSDYLVKNRKKKA